MLNGRPAHPGFCRQRVLGKVLLLEKIGSPSISRTDRPTKIEDIVQAIFVLCSPSNEETRRLIGSGKFSNAADSFADNLPARLSDRSYFSVQIAFE